MLPVGFSLREKGFFFFFIFNSVPLLYSCYSFSLLRFISLKKLKTYLSFDYDKAIEYLNSQIMEKNKFADVKLCDSDQVLGIFFNLLPLWQLCSPKMMQSL